MQRGASMSALAKMIDEAVLSVIDEHPKLFAANSAERARKLIVRRIMKSLTGPKSEGEEQEQPAEATPSAPTAETVRYDDPRAVAYCNLRAIAGAVRPLRVGENYYLPPDARAECVKPFGDLPANGTWHFVIDRRQLQAWREFFDETMPGVPRRDITEMRDGVLGAPLPWPWPPSKTGKTYLPPAEGVAAA